MKSLLWKLLSVAMIFVVVIFIVATIIPTILPHSIMMFHQYGLDTSCLCFYLLYAIGIQNHTISILEKNRNFAWTMANQYKDKVEELRKVLKVKGSL
jgi:uncharacterized membrane protein